MNVPVELDIVGSGDMTQYDARLRELPDVSVVNKWVDEEEIARSLASADLVILPYIEASQSGVAAAALATGVPIVATPVGGLAEQVIDGETGAVAKSMTVQDLATAIQRLVDPTVYEHCSAGALHHARNELGWSRIAARVSEIASGLLEQPLRRSGK